MNYKLLILSLLLLTPYFLFAQCTWTGTSSTDWSTAGNWTGVGCGFGTSIPASDDDVFIPNVVNDPVIDVEAAVAQNVTVQALSVFTMSGGSLTTDGALTIDATATFTMTGGDIYLTKATGAIVNNGTWTATTAGTTHFSRTTDDTQEIDAAVDYGHIEIDGGRIVTVTAAVTNVNDVIVTSGTLVVASGGTLDGDGTGTIDFPDGVTFSVSGANNFPDNYGTYTFNTSSIVDYDLNGAQTIAEHNYANLVLSGGGTKSINDNETVGVVGVLDIEDGAVLATNGPTDAGADQMIRLISTGDGATQTASIDDLSDESTGSITGAGVICERKMNLTGPDAVGWNDWAAPIGSFRLSSWYYKGWPMTGVGGILGEDFPSNPFCSALTYDANISTAYFTFVDDGVFDKNDGWVKVPSITTSFASGTGFRLYTGARDNTLEDIGLPAQGAVVVSLNYTDEATAADAEEGWNLIGNPYMCTIDFDLLNFSGVAETDYEDGFWVYSNTAKGYYVYKESVGSATAPFDILDNTTVAAGLIASHKAFWVKVRSGSQTVTFNENDKITSGTTYIKSTEVLPKIRLQAKNTSSGYLSAGLVALKAGATSGYDRYDAEILKSADNTAPNLYFVAGDKQLSIQSVDKKHHVLPFVVEAPVSGSYELQFWDFDDIPTGYCLKLEDVFTNEFFDLRAEDLIVRDLMDTTTVPRFNLHIVPVLEIEEQTNLSCFDANDGQISIANLYDNVVGLGLYQNKGELVRESMVTDGVTWTDLPAGSYTVREINTNIGCSSTMASVLLLQPAEIIPSFSASANEVDMAQTSGEVTFANTSVGGNTYLWHFSDNDETSTLENPTHTFTSVGTHVVSLVVHNGNTDCAKAYQEEIVVESTVGITEHAETNEVKAYVVNNQINIDMVFESIVNQVDVFLFNVQGQEIQAVTYKQIKDHQTIITAPETTGIYLLKIRADDKIFHFKLNR